MKKNCLGFLTGLFFLAAGSMLIFSCKGKPKDTDISAAIEAKIKPLSELSGLTYVVKEGVATLSGECKDAAAKALFENTVKGIEGVKSVVNNCTIAAPPPPPAPVIIAADDPLIKSVTDALKDYPSVKADVKDGVVTITGELSRKSLPKLMQSLQSLKPKKIDNKLTLK